MLICTHCRTQKEAEKFPKAPKRRTGRGSWCNSCVQEQNKAQFKAKPPEEQRWIRKKANDRTRKYRLNYYRKRRELARATILTAYGGKCACCGEGKQAFLSLDHIDNDGAAHRRQLTMDLAEWACQNDFPPSLQLLCMNCNWGKRLTGVCPHRVES